jgi:xanthine/CO dehydrogenase XdhC/CoxF family maturation factor
MNRADDLIDRQRKALDTAIGFGEGRLLGVVSTQSRGDEAALLAALAVDLDYAAFVGSRKKAEALKAALSERGVTPSGLPS